MADQSEHDKGLKFKTPGLLPGMTAGLILGLLTQLHFLGFVVWELPYWRIIGGGLGGLVLGFLLTIGLGKGFSWLKILPKEQPVRSPGWSLLVTALIGWPFWDVLAEQGQIWIILVLWIAITILMKFLFRWIDQTPFQKSEPWLIIGLLTCVVLLGLFLRFSGLTHGLPEYIVHLDTPKQLRLLPDFVEGNLVPPGRYPVGHMYLYSGIIKLWRSVTGISGPLPELTHETMAEFVPYIITVRVVQSLLSAAIPFFVFLIGRNLWGPWVGLIAAFLVACDPVHLTYSRQEMGEIPQTLWVMVSLFFATRIFLNSKLRDCLLAGLFAGLAVATKMYGGYIIVAAFAATLFSPSRIFRKTGFILFGLMAGIILGSPYLWVDPAGWWSSVVLETFDEFSVRAPGWNWNRLHPIQIGITYLWQGLIHRFHLPWIVLSLLGIGFLFGRHHKKDLFFLVPLLTSLLLVGFALSYLREWDFVNLTPYLAMATSPFVFSLWMRWKDFPKYRRLTLIGLTFFLTFQGSVALSDAIIARFPDTRQLARQWVLRHVETGSRLFYDAKISGATWIPVEAGLKLTGAPMESLPKNKIIPDLPPAHTAVVERIWWDPPLNEPLSPPIQVFDLRNTYWENPEIYFFRPKPLQSSPDLILPHTRVRSPEPAFLNTSWSRRQPLDLLSDSGQFRDQYIFTTRTLNRTGYVLLGHGEGSIAFGPSLGFPANNKNGTIVAGFINPIRRLLPFFPRTHKISLIPKSGIQSLWLGLYPDPKVSAPLLLRYEAWPLLERIFRSGEADSDISGELYLFYATALSAQGKKEEAGAVLNRLRRHRPDFLSQYLLLAVGLERNDDNLLQQLAQATQADLSRENVYWPDRSGDLGELDRLWPKPSQLSEPTLFHLWLPHTFLPGFLNANIYFAWDGKAGSGTARLIVMSVQPKYFLKEIARIDLKPGLGRLDVPLQIPTGPVRLEFRIEADTPCRPQITSLQISPDYPSEFKWRWNVFNRYLSGLKSNEAD